MKRFAAFFGVLILMCLAGCGNQNKLQETADELTAAIHSKDGTEIARIINKQPEVVNVKDSSGQTAIYAAAQAGDLTTVRLLLKNKADVRSKDSHGLTPLHAVTQINTPEGTEIARLLIRNGADCNARDNDGVTPLALARKGNYNAKTELLLVRSGAKAE